MMKTAAVVALAAALVACGQALPDSGASSRASASDSNADCVLEFSKQWETSYNATWAFVSYAIATSTGIAERFVSCGAALNPAKCGVEAVEGAISDSNSIAQAAVNVGQQWSRLRLDIATKC